MSLHPNLPVLTIVVPTFRRPHYALPVLYGLRELLRYAGPRRFLVIDMGSPDDDLKMYRHALRNTDTRIVRDPALNLAAAHNFAAGVGGDVWLVVLDDYELRKPVDISVDIDLLLRDNSIGALRYAPLNQWSHSLPHARLYAEMIEHQRELYYRMDKERTTSPHVALMAAMLYHRRYWDAYGDIPTNPKMMPGECELAGANLFREHAGPTIAWPMRFGDDSPFKHIGYCRSDDYTQRCGDGWGAIDVMDDTRIGNVRVA